MSNKIVGLYAIADTCYLDDTRLLPVVRTAIEGGARMIQYRDKSTNLEQRARQACALAALCRQAGAVFIVNDDVALAKNSAADGVHIGRDDASPGEARATLGERAIIGVSCYNDLVRAEQAQRQGADYVAFGSFFPSRTKPDATRADTQLLKQARRTLHVPIVAIGGITPDNAGALIEAGADALAVIEGVFGKADARAAAAAYVQLFR